MHRELKRQSFFSFSLKIRLEILSESLDLVRCETEVMVLRLLLSRLALWHNEVGQSGFLLLHVRGLTRL